MNEQLKEALSVYHDHEIIFVDDGSSDGTLDVIKGIASDDPRVKFISLTRNFGHQNALKAGLDHSSGDCVITIDADLQQPADRIPDMVGMWLKGHDVVVAVRKNAAESGFFKRISSRVFYRMINLVSDVKIAQGTPDFRLLDRKVVDEICRLRENYLFFRGLVPWFGYRQAQIQYDQSPRLSGESKYTYRKMVGFASSGVTSFSIKPLRISMVTGILVALVAFVYAAYAITIALFTDRALPGWTSILVSVLFLGGIQLIMIGILGEYLGKLFVENKRRPNYIIGEKHI
jgi:dolichol-phosphate mannosyltransferase